MNSKITPFFSIIIPTYNRASMLQRCLDFLCQQTYKKFEVLICDDGSTDDTKEVISSFKNDLNIKYIWEENWGGPARPRNNGIKEASSEWICFLDSDDWWYPQKLKTLKKYLDKYDIDVVFHNLDIYTTKGKYLWKKTREKKLRKPVFIALMKNGRGPANSSVVVRKSIINQVGGLSEDKSLIAVEDYDLLLKISRITDKFYYIPQTLGAYWGGGGNITEFSDRQIARIECVYKKYEMFLSRNEKQQIAEVFNYISGRIKQRMGCFDEALHLFKTSKKSVSLNIKIKSYISILWICISQSRYK